MISSSESEMGKIILQHHECIQYLNIVRKVLFPCAEGHIPPKEWLKILQFRGCRRYDDRKLRQHKNSVIDSTLKKYTVFLPEYCALSCEEAASVIVSEARAGRSYGVTALAVHGLIESINDDELGAKINKIDMIMPDGQPVVWAMNSFYGLNMKLKISGPTLVEEVFRQGEAHELRVFLYGSTEQTIGKFKQHIERKYPGLIVCGIHADRFREATPEEDEDDILRITQSGANIVLVGRGCPRQEHWVADHIGRVDAPMLAIGAAFDYHAGNLKRAPLWMQRAGLEWFFRLIQEPRRLWKRYLTTNTKFIYLFFRQKITGLNKNSSCSGDQS